MVKKTLLIATISIICASLFSQDENKLLWVSQFTGTGNNIGSKNLDDFFTNANVSKIVKDSHGNFYLFGTFSLTVSQGIFSLSSQGGNDVFISKYNSDGSLLWLKGLGGTGAETAGGIELSNDESSIYVTGGFSTTCYFDAYSITSSGGVDVYLAKYDTSGNAVWTKRVAWGAGATNQITSDLEISDNDTISIIGQYQNGDIYFDAGITYPNNGFRNFFYAKFDNTGLINSTFRILSKSNTSNVLSMTYNNNEFAITGYFTDSMYINSTPLYNSYSTGNLFVYKFYKDNTCNWVRTIRGNGTISGRSISMDNSGNVYVCGIFDSPTILIDSTNTLLSTQSINNVGLNDLISFKYSPNGTLQFIKHKGTPMQEDAFNIIAYDDEYIVSGQFGNVIQFAGQSITTRGLLDGFALIYNNNGIEEFALSAGGTQDDYASNCYRLLDKYIFINVFKSSTIEHDDDWDNYWIKTNPNANRDLTIACYGPFYNDTILNNVPCSGGNNGSIELTPNGGRAPYTYSWSDGQSNATATGLSDGTYSVTVIDANGARIRDTITLATTPELAVSILDTVTINCQNINNGTATVLPVNGNTPFTYAWTGSASTTSTANDLGIGWHYVSVTDVCGTKKDSVFVKSLPALSATLSTHAQLLICATDDNGEVTVQTTDGVAPFTYTWDDMVAPAATRNDLDTGWHYVTITDVCAVPIKDSIRVNYLPEVNVNITSSSPASCPVGGDGYAFALATSGIPPYAYAWSNSSSTSNEASDLLSGWQYVTVTDFCKSTVDSINVTWSPVVTSTAAVVSKVTCTGLFNGSATVTPTLGKTPYTYLWSNPAAETTATATQLGTGWNFVTVTDGCTSTHVDSVYMTIESALTDTVILTTQASCPASSNGSATATVITGVPVYSYLWDNGIATATNNTLTVGWHYVTITDGCGPKVDSVQVTNKALMQVTLSTQNILLTCATDLGTVTVQVQDGVAPFTYQWDDILAPGATRTLDTGWHYVTVTDFCNLPYTDSVRVNHLPEVMIDGISAQVASCPAGGDGEATVLAESGVPPYSYAWSNSTSTSATATDLLTGWQYVTVSDYCISKVDSVEIIAMPALEASITDSSNVNCSAGADGSATITASNGGYPYTYSWTNGETTATAIALPAGWNWVTITDLCGTQIVDSVEIFINTTLNITNVQVSATTCPGGNNGSATVVTTGGSAPITYLWDDGQTGQTATGLLNDTVYVTVTDACGTLSTSAYIDHLPLMDINITASVAASCSTSTDGKAFVTATDGSGAYTYQWSNSSSLSPSALDLPVGWNWVTVTDACGSLVDSVQIGVKAPLDATVNCAGPATCPNSSDAVAVVTPVNGVPPYTYAWSNSADTDSIASDLPVGPATVTVTDACGSLVLTMNVISQPGMVLGTETTDLLCFSDSSGTITVTPTLGVPPYTYAWGDTTLTDSLRTGLLAGTYTVTISDVCGTTTQSFVLTQPGALSISLLPTNVMFKGESTGKIDLIVSGGSAPYYFAWSNASPMEDQNNLAEGNYTVTVTDNHGCLAIDSTEIISISSHIVIFSAFTPNDDGKNDVWNIKYIDNFPDCEVSIYNEWGVVVFQSTGYTEPWDGTKDGNPLPAASYYYVIDLKDGSEAYTGSVTLMK